MGDGVELPKYTPPSMDPITEGTSRPNTVEKGTPTGSTTEPKRTKDQQDSTIKSLLLKFMPRVMSSKITHFKEISSPHTRQSKTAEKSNTVSKPLHELPEEVKEILKTLQGKIEKGDDGDLLTNIQKGYGPYELGAQFVRTEDLTKCMQFIKTHIEKRDSSIPFAFDYSFICHLEKESKKDPTLKTILARLLIVSMRELGPIVELKNRDAINNGQLTSIGLNINPKNNDFADITIDPNRYPASIQEALKTVIGDGTTTDGVRYAYKEDPPPRITLKFNQTI